MGELVGVCEALRVASKKHKKAARISRAMGIGSCEYFM
jgi:hypothetical protein